MNNLQFICNLFTVCPDSFLSETFEVVLDLFRFGVIQRLNRSCLIVFKYNELSSVSSGVTLGLPFDWQQHQHQLSLQSYQDLRKLMMSEPSKNSSFHDRFMMHHANTTNIFSKIDVPFVVSFQKIHNLIDQSTNTISHYRQTVWLIA